MRRNDTWCVRSVQNGNDNPLYLFLLKNQKYFYEYVCVLENLSGMGKLRQLHAEHGRVFVCVCTVPWILLWKPPRQFNFHFCIFYEVCVRIIFTEPSNFSLMRQIRFFTHSNQNFFIYATKSAEFGMVKG